jgi:hypothetical protein
MIKKRFTFGVLILLLILLTAIIFILIKYYNFKDNPEINDFISCEAAGYPVMESYPRQCRANGKTFVEILENKNYCTAESRLAEVCITLYDPVCGYFNETIQCIKYPCAQTYSNSCFACMDRKVSYWINGECPI